MDNSYFNGKKFAGALFHSIRSISSHYQGGMEPKDLHLHFKDLQPQRMDFYFIFQNNAKKSKKIFLKLPES